MACWVSPALVKLESCTRPLLCGKRQLLGVPTFPILELWNLTAYVDFQPLSSTHNTSILSCICKLLELYSSKWSRGFSWASLKSTPHVFRKRNPGAECTIVPLARSGLFGRKLLLFWMFTLATSVHLGAYPKRERPIFLLHGRLRARVMVILSAPSFLLKWLLWICSTPAEDLSISYSLWENENFGAEENDLCPSCRCSVLFKGVNKSCVGSC